MIRGSLKNSSSRSWEPVMATVQFERELRLTCAWLWTLVHRITLRKVNDIFDRQTSSACFTTLQNKVIHVEPSQSRKWVQSENWQNKGGAWRCRCVCPYCYVCHYLCSSTWCHLGKAMIYACGSSYASLILSMSTVLFLCSMRSVSDSNLAFTVFMLFSNWISKWVIFHIVKTIIVSLMIIN